MRCGESGGLGYSALAGDRTIFFGKDDLFSFRASGDAHDTRSSGISSKRTFFFFGPSQSLVCSTCSLIGCSSIGVWGLVSLDPTINADVSASMANCGPLEAFVLVKNEGAVDAAVKKLIMYEISS